MKKYYTFFITFVLAILLLMPISATEKIGVANENEIIDIMKIMEIMVGDPYGNLNLDSTVTRAEFTKMLVRTSPVRNDIYSVTLSTSPFPDLRNNHWASSYVSVAAKAGYIKGYLDGTFRPNSKVTLEESATMVLRLLGYTNEDFTGVYPYAQLSKYEDLGLDRNILKKQGDNITRRDCMNMFYNLLCTNNKSGTIYCQTIGFPADANGNIDYSSLLKQNTKGPYIIIDQSFSNIFNFSLEEAQIYRDGKKVYASSLQAYDVLYYSSQLKTIWSYSDKSFGIIENISPNKESPVNVTVSGKTYTLSNSTVKNKFSVFGTLNTNMSIMLIMDRNGEVCDAIISTPELYEKYKIDDDDYLNSVNASLDGPYIVAEDAKWKENIKLPFASLKIYYKNALISKEELRIDDVIYYSEAFSSIWVYRKTATGIISDILPNTSSPTSVIISGKSYVLDSNNAKYKLSNFGSFEKDDFVTLLLGRNGTVVDVKFADLNNVEIDEDDFFTILDSTIEGPKTVNDLTEISAQIAFDINNASIYKDSKKIEKSEIRPNDIIYYSKSFNSVWVYRTTATGIIETVNPNKEAPTSVIVKGKTYLLSGINAKFKLSSYGNFNKKDFVTLLLGRNGEVADIINGSLNSNDIDEDDDISYTDLVNATLEGPFTVLDETYKNDIKVDFSTAIYNKNQSTVTLDQIEKYDILYFSKTLNTVWIFNKKDSGILEEILPSKSTPLQIKVSGTIYTLETDDVKYKVSTIGSFNIGDKVTVLKSKDGDCADIIFAESEFKSELGIITKLETKKSFVDKNNDTYLSDVITIVDLQGNTHMYQSDSDYFEKGDIVRVDFEGSRIAISKINTNYANANLENLKTAIIQNKFAADAGIMDVYKDSYKIIYPQSLAKTELRPKDVLYYKLNNNGEITSLVLNDFTGDIHKYGIFNVSYSAINGTRTYYSTIDGKTEAFTGNGYSYLSGISCFKYQNAKIADIVQLEKLKVNTITENFITAVGKSDELPVWENADIYIRDGGNYTLTTIDNIQNSNYEIEAYVDDTVELGGKVRIIIAY